MSVSTIQPVVTVQIIPPPVVEVDLSEVGPQGPPGPPGVVSASAPATYDSSGHVVGVAVGTVAGTVTAGDDARVVGAVQKSSNLADLANLAVARGNLGLGSAATHAATDFDVAGAAATEQARASAAEAANASAITTGDATTLVTATGRAAAFALILGG